MAAFLALPLASPAPHLTHFSPPPNYSTRPMFTSAFASPLSLPSYHKSTPITCSPFCMRLNKPADSLNPSTATDARRQQLYDIITSSPVFQSAQLSLTHPSSPGLDEWIKMGSILENALGRQANDVRVFQYYLPIYFWIVNQLDFHRTRLAKEGQPPRPLILGFSCPQGGGKTTMTTFLEALLRTKGKRVQIASLDDFYFTNKEQRAIAKANPDNRLLEFRGNPGTHDLSLLNNTLDSLRQGAETVTIPRYDKTAFSGRGDRAPVDQWKHISGKTDVLLLEGWCVGFEPVDKENLIHPDLGLVNEALKQFLPVYKKMDALFVIEISNMDWVYDWRLQAERGTRATGRPGLTDEQVIDFVSRFMPAYKQYTARLYNRPTPLVPDHELHIAIDSQRRPVQRSRQPTFGG